MSITYPGVPKGIRPSVPKGIRPSVPHYTQGEVEFIDAIQSALTPQEYQGFLKGQVIKYLWRCDHKGTPRQDLAKAADYLSWLIATYPQGTNGSGPG